MAALNDKVYGGGGLPTKLNPATGKMENPWGESMKSIVIKGLLELGTPAAMDLANAIAGGAGAAAGAGGGAGEMAGGAGSLSSAEAFGVPSASGASGMAYAMPQAIDWAGGAGGAAGGLGSKLLGAGAMTGLSALGGATGAGGGKIPPELQQILDLQKQRMQMQNPLFEAISRLAMSRLPTAQQQPMPGGTGTDPMAALQRLRGQGQG